MKAVEAVVSDRSRDSGKFSGVMIEWLIWDGSSDDSVSQWWVTMEMPLLFLSQSFNPSLLSPIPLPDHPRPSPFSSFSLTLIICNMYVVIATLTHGSLLLLWCHAVDAPLLLIHYYSDAHLFEFDATINHPLPLPHHLYYPFPLYPLLIYLFGDCCCCCYCWDDNLIISINNVMCIMYV